MFIENTITLWVEAVQHLFGADFPYEDMKGMKVHTDYPLDKASYPGLWVQFVPQGEVKNAGIGHEEWIDVGDGPIKFSTWTFGGAVEITVAALSSLERAIQIDWLSKGVAFSTSDEANNPLSRFREMVEENDLVGMNVIWESFIITGFAETPGTPWGTDDVIYEATVTLTVHGEFRYAPTTNSLVPLTAIVVADELYTTETHPPDPLPPQDGWM